MAHVPHILIPGPWETETLPVTDEQAHHLRRVLRTDDTDPVSYTDGLGAIGTGVLNPEGIRRGPESSAPEPRLRMTMAVAPPRSADRARFVVEKLGELGVDRLVWLLTDFGQARAPQTAKAKRWATGALEQSRGARLMDIGGPIRSAELPEDVWMAHRGGGSLPDATGDVTLAIGPEGGFSADELARGAPTVNLGARVLRVETAALVAAGLVLNHLGRMNT